VVVVRVDYGNASTGQPNAPGVVETEQVDAVMGQTNPTANPSARRPQATSAPGRPVAGRFGPGRPGPGRPLGTQW
jgi:hypothetical protein